MPIPPGVNQSTPAMQVVWRTAAAPVRQKRATRKRTKVKAKTATRSKRKTKLKFGSPAWRKKYLKK